jgi:predicted transcriptional regulator
MVAFGGVEMRTPKIREFMTKDPIFLYVPGNRRDAMKIFVNETISGVPVLREDDDKLVGIVTRADVFAKPTEDQLAMIMRKKPITCNCDCDLTKAAKRMIENNVHRLPILDDDGKLVGIISPMDILPYIDDLDLDQTVETVMRTEVVPLYRLMPANVALEIMTLTSAQALPVLDDDAKVSGIITDRDIYAQVSVDTQTVESDLGPETEDDHWTWESLRNIMKFYYDIGKVEIPHTPIEEFMVKNPDTVQTKATVSKAARLLARGRFNQLPVIDMGGHLSGMVYDFDLLSVLIK